MNVPDEVYEAIIESLDPTSGSFKKLLICLEKYEVWHPEMHESMTYREQQNYIKMGCVQLLKKLKDV